MVIPPVDSSWLPPVGNTVDFVLLRDGSVRNYAGTPVPGFLRDMASAFNAEVLEGAAFLWSREQQILTVAMNREWRGGQAGVHVVGKNLDEVPWGLTRRELDVAGLVGLGMSNAEIAQTLFISVRTVTTHLDKLMRKARAGNRASVGALVIERGLVLLPLPDTVKVPEELVLGKLVRPPASDTPMQAPRVPVRKLEAPFITIGTLIPSIGRGRSDALEMMNGAIQAVEEINQHGGIRGQLLRLEIANVDPDNGQAPRPELDRLMQVQPVALTSGYLAGQLQAMERAAGVGIPFLHSSASCALGRAVAADANRFRNTFQFSPNDDDYAPSFVAFMSGLKSTGQWTPSCNRLAFVVQSRWEFIDLGLGPALELAEQQGWDPHIVYVHESAGSDSWGTAAREAQKIDAAAVMVGSYFPSDQHQFIREFLGEPTDTLLYSAYAPSISGFAQGLDISIEGLIWSTTTGTYPDQIGTQFVNQYARRFGRAPGLSHAGIAYDRIHILAQAWRQVDDVRDFDDVGKAIASSRYRGVNGTYYFDPVEHHSLSFGHGSMDPSLSQAHTIFQIQRGQNVLLAPSIYAKGQFTPPPWTMNRS